MKQLVYYDNQKTYQRAVHDWMIACFGEEIAADQRERNHRFLEEAIELVQAVGCTKSEAHQLVDYVFGREIGKPAQEVGGVMVTLAALCEARGIDMESAGRTELARVWTKVEQIRAKHARKPKMSPLPGASESQIAPPHPDITEAVEMQIAVSKFRMQCRVESCLERHKFDEQAAVTSAGIWISYLFSKAIVSVLEKAEAEIGRLRRVIERDRSLVAAIHANLCKVMGERRWLTLGRGSYEWNDDRYKEEFGHALDALEGAVAPMRCLAANLADCPVDQDQIKLARAGE